MGGTKTCIGPCGKTLALSLFYQVTRNGRQYAQSRCKTCHKLQVKQIEDRDPHARRKRDREWARVERQRNPNGVRLKELARELPSRYGITLQDYLQLLEKQGGVCAICKNPNKRRRLSVDHNHVTGEIRGLLCDPCNSAMSRLDAVPDWALSALAYESQGTGIFVKTRSSA